MGGKLIYGIQVGYTFPKDELALCGKTHFPHKVYAGRTLQISPEVDVASHKTVIVRLNYIRWIF